MQVQEKPSFYQSFGGINFMEADYRRMGIEKLFTQHVGSRSVYAAYSYSDIIKSLYYMFSIGGDVLDDLNTLKEQVQDHPSLSICSPDTVEYAFNELMQPNVEHTTDKGVTHQVNEHSGFNKLLVNLCLRGKLLTPTDVYTMDYDGHITENSKADNAINYKGTESYYPVIASINKLPIYMQNRNGNTPESYHQLEVISKSFAQCEEAGIQVGRFRADACCYEKKTVEFLESKAVQYYIRAEMNNGLRIALQDETEWQSAVLGNRNVEVCSMEEKLFGSQQYRRVVAYRYKVQGQLKIDDANGYRYSAVVTSDTTATPLDCITFYNQRGCEGEHHFKELDNDFGWKKLPFANMEMNTIYMYSTIVAYLMFNIFKHNYAAKVDFINPQMRLKNFTLHFVTLTAKWIKSGRQFILRIFTTKKYAPVYAT